MKNKLDWQNQEVVNIYDEVNLWSAPFGRLLLEKLDEKIEKQGVFKMSIPMLYLEFKK